MSRTQLTKRVYPMIGIAISLVAVLIVRNMDAASLIAADLAAGVQGAAGLLSVIFLVKMLEEL